MPDFKRIEEQSEYPWSQEWRDVDDFKSKDRLVDENGKVVGADHSGRKYKIIEKKERTYTHSERFGRAALGILAVAGSLFLGLLSKSVRNLFSKENESVRIGRIASEADLPADVGSKTERVNKKLDSGVSVYAVLDQEVAPQVRTFPKDSIVYLQDDTGKRPEALLGLLGSGGNKRAILIANDQALILPNMVDGPALVASRWERVVSEEVAMSKFLQEIGLLSPDLKKVKVTLSETSKAVIPTYVSETFNHLAISKGWFVIDLKSGGSSAWERDKHHIFDSEVDRLDVEKWDPVLDSLLTDIATICVYDIPANSDSLNVAIVNKNHRSSNLESNYELRFFGTDYASKHNSLSIPSIEKKINFSSLTEIKKSELKEEAQRILRSLVGDFFYYEFNGENLSGEKSKNIGEVLNNLVEKHTPEILARIEAMSQSTST